MEGKMTRSKIILSAILLLLASCRFASIQEVTRSPVPTLGATLPVAASGTPVPTPGVTLPATATATPARDPLNNTRWALLSLHGEPLLEGTRITLEFSRGFIRGFAGCNEYDSRQVIGDAEIRGMYKATEDGSLDTPGVTLTLLACLTPEGANDQEDAYLEALAKAVAFRLVENRLELQDATGRTTLVFTR
jgi:heat shock protein HslJ